MVALPSNACHVLRVPAPCFCVCMCRRALHSWGFFVSLCSTTGTSTSNSSTVAVSSGTALQVTVSMSGEEWNCTNVHVVAGMDVTTQEACSTAFEGNTIVTSCVPVAVVVTPTSCAASDDDDYYSGSDSGSSSGSRRALGVVSGSASPSGSPSPGTLPSPFSLTSHSEPSIFKLTYWYRSA